MESRSMEAKTCLITGGGSGIGYAAARVLARLGATVVIVDRRAANTATAAARIVEETGNQAVCHLLADLSSQRETRRLAEQVREKMTRLDVLVNNAGAIFLSHRRSVDGIEGRMPASRGDDRSAGYWTGSPETDNRCDCQASAWSIRSPDSESSNAGRRFSSR